MEKPTPKSLISFLIVTILAVSFFETNAQSFNLTYSELQNEFKDPDYSYWGEVPLWWWETDSLDTDKKAFVCDLPWIVEEKEIRFCDRSLATSILYNQCPNNQDETALKILSDSPQELGISYPCNAIWRYWALAKKDAIQVVIDELRLRWGNMDSVLENNTLQEFWEVKHDSGHQWSYCALSPLIMIYHGILGISPTEPGFEKCKMEPRLGDLEELSVLAHTVKGTIQFEMNGKKSNRKLSISIPKGMDCDIILDQREKVDLVAVSKNPANKHAYRLIPGKKVELHLKHL